MLYRSDFFGSVSRQHYIFNDILYPLSFICNDDLTQTNNYGWNNYLLFYRPEMMLFHC